MYVWIHINILVFDFFTICFNINIFLYGARYEKSVLDNDPGFFIMNE